MAVIDPAPPRRDPPWLFRTYAGHSTPEKSNALYRANLAKGQTGLSVAFDLPTQTGYDPDHVLARGEVGKVGVPIAHLGDMRALFAGIELAQMNTSMTINAPAAWLLALYVVAAEEQGAKRAALRGTTQNDVVKEYLSRGTFIFPPKPSLKITADIVSWCAREAPDWNPTNICSYHLQEAGATPAQELGMALANSIALLDAIKAGGEITAEDFPAIFGRLSFFVNAGIRFITEICKMRAFTLLWDEIGAARYGVADAKLRRFRYGVQVNSLGLTEAQAENNVYRILLEMLAVTLSKSARARAVQLPAWNEALGLPRPFDQQWSLRAQQILAFETDLLEFEDIFDGSPVIAAKVEALCQEARALMAEIDAQGGMVAAIENGFLKAQLVQSQRARLGAIESGAQKVVGVNCYETAEPSPLAAGVDAIETVDPMVERGQIERLQAWRAQRDSAACAAALDDLARAARDGANIMPATIACARAGASTGEWADRLRAVFGDYRAPTGVALVIRDDSDDIAPLQADVARVSQKLGRTLTYVLGKPGLDGHSNGAEQVVARARAGGMEALYHGIRQTPDEIVALVKAHDAHVLGLSILSGAHLDLTRAVIAAMRREGLGHVPIVVGGIIPPEDAQALRQSGVARVYTPKDYRITESLRDIVAVVEAQIDADVDLPAR
ncbi:MAG TPA: protein meaA [Hyphomonadaceae bacterium]|nr:protein meaA [Hyphomonadaceae bacterium]